MSDNAESGEAILVVDDEDSVRRIAQRVLTRLGYSVVEANNAAAALQILATEKFALLLSDIVMPGEMDGVALATEAVARWPGIKVILTSGYPDGHVGGADKALPAEFRLLSKPYRAQALTTAVQECLRRDD